MTAAASHVDASPLYQKADEMQYTRHKQVVTYNGPCLVLRDNEPPRPFIHPHNKTAFRSLREMVGLDEDGMPMATPAWHCSRRRHHGCDAPRFRTCLDAQERAHRAQLQRLRRVLLARASQRRARQQQGRLRRRGPPKPVWEEARCRGVDRDLERGLRAAAAAATAAAAAGEEGGGGGGGRPWIAEAVERTLNRPGEAEKRLREPFRVRLLRLAAPQAVRKMPWTEGYGGSQDHLTCDKNWINLLRTLDWQAEAALKKRRDRQAELAAAKQARKARRDAAAAAAVDGAAPTPTPPQAAAATSGRGGGGGGGSGGGGGGAGVPRSRTPSSARDGSAQADAAWAAAHTERWVRQTGRLTPPPTPQTPRGPRQPSSGGGGGERSGVVREQGHARVSVANLMAATKSVQEAAMARVEAAPMAPRPPPGCSDKGSRGEGPRRPRSASSVVSSRHLLKQKILEITSFATV